MTCGCAIVTVGCGTCAVAVGVGMGVALPFGDECGQALLSVTVTTIAIANSAIYPTTPATSRRRFAFSSSNGRRYSAYNRATSSSNHDTE